MSSKKSSAAAVRVAERASPARAKGAASRQVPLTAAPDLQSLSGPFSWSLIYLFARIFYAVRMRTEEALKPHSLTPMQFTILATLGRWPDISSAELSRRFNVTPQTMGEMVANLERRSLVSRGQDQSNRRALRLSLTDAGRRLVSACDDEMNRVEAEMVKGLSPAQRAELKAALAALHGQIGRPVG